MFARPDRDQDGHDVRRRDLIDTLVADVREGVFAERRPPERSRLAAVFPGFAMDRDDLLKRRLERRRPGLASLCQQIATVGDGAAVPEGAIASHCERDDRPRAQAEITPTTVDGDPLDPTLRPARGDDEMQRAAIAVPAARRQRAHLRGGQFSHGDPPLPTPRSHGYYHGRRANQRKALEARETKIRRCPNDYGVSWNFLGEDETGRWRPQRDSNPCLSLERARS